MLVAAPDQRGTGVGRALVAFAEEHSRERGLRAIQLELLVPRTWRHPSKEFLKAWYGRIGYRPVRTGTIDENHPHLAPLLATPCDLNVYEKPLQAHQRLAMALDRVMLTPVGAHRPASRIRISPRRSSSPSPDQRA